MKDNFWPGPAPSLCVNCLHKEDKSEDSPCWTCIHHKEKVT